MADDFKNIIAQLEKRKAAIERALESLREIDGEQMAAPAKTASAPRRGRPPKRKSTMSPEGKQRLIAALKRRWALKKKNAKAADKKPSAKKAPGKKASAKKSVPSEDSA